MLGKLIKHEFRALSRFLLPIHILLLVACLIGRFMFQAMDTMDLPNVILIVSFVFLISIWIVVPCATSILIVVRYYKSLYTDEGYLTNVLPVSATDHILSKMLVFGAWSILNALSVLASFAFLLLPSAIRYFTANTLLFYNKTMTFSDFLSYLWAQITCVADAAFSLIGITNHIGMALFSIVGFFTSLFFGILLFYAAISIGSLVSNHKILTAVLSFIGLSTAIQTFGGIGIVQIFQTSTPPAAVTTSSVSTLVITVVLCVVLFLICRYILGRRLNLS